jgi:hypothetical protein
MATDRRDAQTQIKAGQTAASGECGTFDLDDV